MAKTKTYSFGKTVWKGVKAAIIFGLSFAATQEPVATITVGSVLTALANGLKYGFNWKWL